MYLFVGGGVTLCLSLGPVTTYHRPGGLNSRHLFLPVLEAGKSKVKGAADPVSGGGLLAGLLKASYCCSCTWRGVETGSKPCNVSYQSPNSTHEAPAL